jgi:lipoyl(octanoyl) transferase
MHEYSYIDWDLIQYEEARKKQLIFFDTNIQLKLSGKHVKNQLIFCEHYPVITLGKSAKDENLLFNKEWLHRKGVQLHKTERGGDITFHGPGQLVAYPHFDLDSMKMGIKNYIYAIEEVIIRTLKSFGIHGDRFEGYTGVWIEKETEKARKIAAIGVKCSRGVTMHGLALNVNTDLSFFNLIVPCGIEGKTVTSIQKELKKEVYLEEVKAVMQQKFEEVFNLENAELQTEISK